MSSRMIQWRLTYDMESTIDSDVNKKSQLSPVSIHWTRKLGRTLIFFSPTGLLIVAVLLIWQFVLTKAAYLGVPPQYLGSPSGIAKQFLVLLNNGYTDVPLWKHFAMSIFRTLSGVVLAVLIGIPLGLGIGLSKFLDRLLGPIIGFLRPIPALAWIPIVVIWLGIDEPSKIFVVFMSSLLFVTTGASLGVKAVPTDYRLVAKNYGLSNLQLLRFVVLPPALPQVLAGMRTALTIGWAVVVAAELIGASEGLGYMIRNAAEVFDVNTVYVGILIIGLVGVCFEYGFRYVENKLLHWQVSR
jgi:taurine transport system permease protein